MLFAMTPNMAPVGMFADENEASVEDTATQSGGVGQPTPEGENGQATALENGNESISTYKVSFILPAGYAYGDESNAFTIDVNEGDTVAPVSIPVVPVRESDLFTGWKVNHNRSEFRA
jgi:hypothetical protein